MELLDGLNPRQKEAVIQTEGPLLILAGAGSGKTRVLTHRIAYLIQQKGVYPGSIMAITFTNKAAKEMRERVDALIGQGSERIWVSTFHSSCVRILRNNIEKLGYSSSFTIYDTSDQETLMKDCLKELNYNEKNFPPKAILSEIGRAKDELIDPDSYLKMYQSDFRQEKVGKLYSLYQRKLKENNAVDFDDLICKTIEVFEKHPEVLEEYHMRFKYFLVDEYQDTNTAQYKFVRLLASKSQNLCVVGDDDQCLLPDMKISTPQGEIRIEEVQEGEKVFCASGRGEVQQGYIEKKIKNKYNGPIIKIKTRRGKEIKGTPNHIGFAKLNPEQGVYYVYLMYKKSLGYRIGQTQGVRSRKNEVVNGLMVRLNQEHADKMWILKVCFSREEATFYEELYSTKYSIPKILFHSGSRGLTLSQEYINRLYMEIDTRQNVQKLMEELMIFEEYPHHLCNAVIRGETVRRIINITAFGGRKTGKEAGWCAHRINLNTSGEELKEIMKQNDFPTRKGERNTWRIETERKDYDEANQYAKRITVIEEDLEICKKARLTEEKSFFYMPFSHMKPSMSIPIFEDGKIIEDIIEEVEVEAYSGDIYDLSVPNYRQYIAEGILVHNSIYGWRGANIRNILDFEKDFKNAQVIKLEQNYRCTQKILEAANQVIQNNQGRKSKVLWTDNPCGDAVQVYEAQDERDEANFIGEKIAEGVMNGKEYKHFAVLYRTNAQSRVLEEIFMKQTIPYQILGGLRFYDRKEIKDLVAYLRLIVNPTDSISLKRIINVPKRGIGDTTINRAQEYAIESNRSLYESFLQIDEIGGMTRAAGKIHEFLNMIGELRTLSQIQKVSEFIETVLKRSGYIDALEKENTVEARSRIENLKEFISVAVEHERKQEEPTLTSFLENVSLVSDVDQMEGGDNRVVMMTIHSAKGLEFPTVFLCGMEQGIFPSYRSITSGDEEKIEEERRLCYVGITRAEEALYLSHARCRMLYGRTEYYAPSIFVEELLPVLQQNLESRRAVVQPPLGRGQSNTFDNMVQRTKPVSIPQNPNIVLDFTVGDEVSHKKFGTGEVKHLQPAGKDVEVTVDFPRWGEKKLMAKFSGLKKI